MFMGIFNILNINYSFILKLYWKKKFGFFLYVLMNVYFFSFNIMFEILIYRVFVFVMLDYVGFNFIFIVNML